MVEPTQRRAEFVKTCDRAALAYDGDPREARRLYEKALQLEDGSTTDDERFIVRKSLAECCYETEKLEDAETYFREALALSESKIAAYGPQHEISISIRHNLAYILSQADIRNSSIVNKLEEAIGLYRQNIQLLVGDGDRSNLSDSRSSLAFCLGELAKRHGNGDAANAFALRVEAANIYSDLLAMKAVNGATDSNSMIQTRHNYASILYDMKRYQEAKEQFLRNETVLKDLPTKRRKNLDSVIQETDSYLEACSEATNDLALSLYRRTTDPLDRHKKAREKPHASPRPKSECDPISALVPISHRPRAKSTLEVPTPLPHLRRPKSEEPLTTRPDREGQAHRPKSASDAALSEKGSRGRGRSRSPRPRSPTRGELYESEFDTGHHADAWFLQLSRVTHSLLNYNDDQKFKRQRVRVAVLDSGLHRPAKQRDPRQRADIRRNLKSLKEYKGMTASEDWVDHSSSMHGTNCASLVLQVAPHSDLYIANVVAEDGRPTADLVIDALEWALAKEREIDIITMSLGLDSFNHKISDLIDRARQQKVLVFASSSNKGDLAKGTFPAMLPTVFDIKSTTGLGIPPETNPRLTDEKANFMFLGVQVAIAALQNPNYRLTGNSYATPIAAGTAALVLDLSAVAQLWAMANMRHQTESSVRASKRGDNGEINMLSAVGLRVDTLLRKYEGMSVVFKQMSGDHAPGRYHYNVHPWMLLRKDPEDPFHRASDEWRTYVRLCAELGKMRGLGQY